MAEEKKTTSTRTKATTTKSSTAKTTAAKTTTTKKTTTKSTASKATATKATKAPASKLTAEERAKKEALRKEVLEHYTRQQNYRATTPSYLRPPVYEYEEPVYEMEEDFTPIPTSQQYFEERSVGATPGSVYTRNTSTIAREYSDYEPEARAYAPSEPLEPTSISTNSKITSLNSKKKDPYRRERVREGIKSFFAQDGLFYFFGFISLIGVLVIMFT